MRSLLLLAAVASCAACQTYDFERVEPHALATHTQVRVVVARGLMPNVMLTVDVSGSMAEPIDGRRPECQWPDGLACGPARPCPGGCATRLTEVKRAIHYIRNNAQKHAAARGDLYSSGYVDPYSSDGPIASTLVVLPPAQTWLVRVGWQRAPGP